jgi:uncharacterized protein
MEIVWDEPKRLSNIDKHGLDFADVLEFDWERALILAAEKRRFKAIGTFRDGVAVVIFLTLGSEALSIISFRRASVKERKAFDGKQR